MLEDTTRDKMIAVITGVGISLTPIEFRPELAAGILKVAILVVISLLLTGKSMTRYFLLVPPSLIGGIFGCFKLPLHYIMGSTMIIQDRIFAYVLILGLLAAWLLGMLTLMALAFSIVKRIRLSKPLPKLCFNVIIASGLAC